MALPFYTGQVPTADDFNALMPKADLSASSGSSLVGHSQGSTYAVERTIEEKLREIVTPMDLGAVGDGVTDDTGALQAAIDYALTVGGEVDLLGKTYGISSQLSVNGNYGITVKNGLLRVVAGTWDAGVNGAVINIQRPINVPPAKRHKFSHVDIDCNSIAKTGWYIYRVSAGSVFESCSAVSYSEAGFWIKATGDGNNGIRINDCWANEINFGEEPKNSTYSERTASGFLIDTSADINMSGCSAAMNKYNLRCTGNFWNGSFINCKFWSGAAREDANCVCVLIEADVHRLIFIGNRFDDGAVKLYSFDHRFKDNEFIQFTAASILQLVATLAGESASGLHFSNNTLAGSTTGAALLTEGVGTWTDVDCYWFNNKSSYARATPFTIDGKATVTPLIRADNNTFWVGSNEKYQTSLGLIPKVQVSSETGGGFGAFGFSATSMAYHDLCRSTSGVNGNFIQTPDATNLAIYSFTGVDDAGSRVRGGGMKMASENAWTTSNRKSKLVFQVCTGTAPYDALEITNTGNVNNITGVYQIAGTQVVGPQETGWTAATGTPNKGAYATYDGQTASANYVQAEAQSTDDATKANSQRIKAIEDALRTHGLIN